MTKAARAMRRAWEIVRMAIANFGGNTRQYMAEALRMAWNEINNTRKAVADRIEELEALGFKRWTKNGMDRLYINASVLGLNCSHYNTGNISGAWFNGDRISNSEGRRMSWAKTYIDIKTGKCYSDNATLKAAACKLAGIED